MGDTEELIPEGVTEKALSILQDKQVLGKQMGVGQQEEGFLVRGKEMLKGMHRKAKQHGMFE